MSVNTLMLDFSIDASRVGDESGQKSVYENIEMILERHLTEIIFVYEVKVDGGSLKMLKSDKGSIIYLRIYERGLVTISIEYFKQENEDPLMSFEFIRELEYEIMTACKFGKCQAYPPFKRGAFCRYYPTADERLMEYDIDNVVYDERSRFQKVQIVHSKSLGNMLVLDELQNISEADLIYTETLMQRGVEDYKDKDIIILGGGDGALLYELLKEKPKHVTMMEIDETVINACSKHLRSICGDVLDNMTGENYEIIIGDCFVALNKYIRDDRKVDYIFGDLTDIPIADESSGDNMIWGFIKVTMEQSFKILKPGGKFMTHGNGAGCPESLELFEQHLNKMTPPVQFTRTEAFIPSFLENWVFYQVQRKDIE